MVTDTRDDAVLEWDVFLLDDSFQHSHLRGEVDHIAGWRKMNWPQIVRELREDFQMKIQGDVEPHWMSPGSAILWRQLTTVEGKKKEGSDGQRHNSEGFKESQDNWKPTSPLPIGNANQLYRYLVKKGFRLRPPTEGVDAQYSELLEVVESADSQKAPVPKKEYICLTHNFSIASWRGYLQHCDMKREIPDMSQMPEEEAKAVGSYTYYCAVHRFGSNSAKGARHHVSWYHKTRATALSHASVDQMKVKKGAS